MDNCTDIKVSVIIPVYNAASYLSPALDSIIEQTLEEIEIICIDDGSTDSSLEIIKEYQKKDNRIRIVTENNAGPALARNNGIRRARGKYLAFVDADDFYEATFIEELYELSERENLDIAIAKYDFYNTEKARFEKSATADYSSIFEEGKITSKTEYPDQILASTVGSAWNKLFRREFVINKNLAFLTDVRIYEDVYFVVNAMAFAERVGKVHKILMHHRIHSEQSRAKMFRKYHMQVPEVYLKIREFLMHNGIYAPLSRAYLNLSASRCYKLFNLLAGGTKEKYWDLLHEKYALLLDWCDKKREEFESSEIADFVIYVQLYTYSEYMTRVEKGKKLAQNPEMIKKRNKIRGFFRKIFKRKNK